MAHVWFASQLGAVPRAAKKPLNKQVPRGIASGSRHRARNAARCRRGVTAIEFAMVSTVLVPMLMGMVEFGLQSAVAVALDNAARTASRAGSMGCQQPDGTRAGQASKAAIERAARAAGHGLLNGKLQVDPVHYSSAGAAINDRPDRKGGAGGAGLGGHTVVYELRYDQPSVFIRTINTPWGVIGRENFVHTSVVTVQNEPFPDSRPGALPCS